MKKRKIIFNGIRVNAIYYNLIQDLLYNYLEVKYNGSYACKKERKIRVYPSY